MKKFVIIFLFLGLAASAFAQTKARKTAAKKAVRAQPVATTVGNVGAGQTAPAPIEADGSNASAPQKKNQREESPVEISAENKVFEKKNQTQKSGSASVANRETAKPSAAAYYYEFTHREFSVRHVIIEHDERGKGKITFLKRDFREPVSDPIQLSDTTLEKINNLFQNLNFLESTEAYQSPERDYAHLGTARIRRLANGRERAVEFNWTENKDARALADEYRRIGNQYVWQFDMSVARENQPLEAPGLMDMLEAYLKRNEISDPMQMIPLLKDLSNDERIPLMARNRATKLIKMIEKKK